MTIWVGTVCSPQTKVHERHEILNVKYPRACSYLVPVASGSFQQGQHGSTENPTLGIIRITAEWLDDSTLPGKLSGKIDQDDARVLDCPVEYDLFAVGRE